MKKNSTEDLQHEGKINAWHVLCSSISLEQFKQTKAQELAIQKHRHKHFNVTPINIGCDPRWRRSLPGSEHA